MRFRFALQPLLERRSLIERERRARLAQACRESYAARRTVEGLERDARSARSLSVMCGMESAWEDEALLLARRRVAAERREEERVRADWERASGERARIERMRERAYRAFLVEEERREERELEEARRSAGGGWWTH